MTLSNALATGMVPEQPILALFPASHHCGHAANRQQCYARASRDHFGPVDFVLRDVAGGANAESADIHLRRYGADVSVRVLERSGVLLTRAGDWAGGAAPRSRR